MPLSAKIQSSLLFNLLQKYLSCPWSLSLSLPQSFAHPHFLTVLTVGFNTNHFGKADSWCGFAVSTQQTHQAIFLWEE